MNAPDVRISATVTAFNAIDDVADCIDALLRQKGVAIDEVLVIDNASSDGTAELVESRFGALGTVRVIRMPANEGPCPARNAGLRAARNRIVFQVDQDVVVRDDCVARLLPHLLADPTVAVVSPRALDASNPEIVHYDGGSFHYAGVMALRHFYQPAAQCGDAVEDVDAFISLAALLDRDKVLDVGAYDPAFFILFEDHDLSFRLRMCSWRIVSVPQALVDHRSGTKGISFRGGARYPARRLYLHSRNRWMTILKCYRWRTVVATLPGVLLLGVVYVLFAAQQGALGDYVRAKSSLIGHWPHIREERRRMRRLRRRSDRALLGAPDLTFSPRIERGFGAALFEKSLSLVLRGWWWIARWFCG